MANGWGFIELLSFAAIVGIPTLALVLFLKFQVHIRSEQTKLQTFDVLVSASEAGWDLITEEESFLNFLNEEQLALIDGASVNFILKKRLLKHQVWLFDTVTYKYVKANQKSGAGYLPVDHVIKSILIKFEDRAFPELVVLNDLNLEILSSMNDRELLKIDDENEAFLNVSFGKFDASSHKQMALIEKAKALVDHVSFTGLIFNGPYIALYLFKPLPDSKEDFVEVNQWVEEIINAFMDGTNTDNHDPELKILK